MPNWIEGTLKIRGPYENVRHLYEEGLNATDIYHNPIPKEKWLKIDTYEEYGDGYFDISILDKRWAHVEGTHRAFITGEHDICVREVFNAPELIVVSDIHQAKCFKEYDWISIAKKYSIDIRLWRLESNMHFGQSIEINRLGEVLISELIGYEDWIWECPLPFLGG